MPESSEGAVKIVQTEKAEAGKKVRIFILINHFSQISRKKFLRNFKNPLFLPSKKAPDVRLYALGAFFDDSEQFFKGNTVQL